MLGNQNVTSRRLVLSARHLYFFQQKKECDKNVKESLKDEKDDSKVYVLGYN